MVEVLPELPVLKGRFVSLRPLDTRDYDWIYNLVTSPEIHHRWRLRGRTMSPAVFATFLAQSAQIQYVICRKTTGEPIGVIDAYNANPLQQTMFISIVVRPDLHQKGWPMEAHLIFLNLLFSVYALRKIYVEGFSFNIGFVERIAFAKLEGHLRHAELFCGSYMDWLIFSVSRGDWIASGSPEFLSNINSK